MTDATPPVTLTPVGPDNWRTCAELTVTDAQSAFVAPVTRYLTLCAYDDGPWRPFAVDARGRIVGFVMFGVDPADNSAWIGGLVIDSAEQRRGYGRAAVLALVEVARRDSRSFVALTYEPANQVAKTLYADLGFAETGETDGDEVVARLNLDPD
ncbi:MAG TPA: GNAT family N-acetyltransferase [Candidatus Limnocylindria bacterium]|nr:GNAT family N-acetyltransferase [Candidatus Limnocylindria bacterium]